MIFQVESLKTCWPEIMGLASAHWMETEAYRHGQPFSPSFDRYTQYEDMGALIQCTARVEGKMVGYATMYVCPSMHTQKLIAVEDTYFLLPEHRKGRNAIRLYRFAEEECRKRGAVEMIMTAKTTNSVGRILEYLGFKEVARQYSKELGEVFTRKAA